MTRNRIGVEAFYSSKSSHGGLENEDLNQTVLPPEDQLEG